jgi:hypothetical protein
MSLSGQFDGLIPPSYANTLPAVFPAPPATAADAVVHPGGAGGWSGVTATPHVLPPTILPPDVATTLNDVFSVGPAQRTKIAQWLHLYANGDCNLANVGAGPPAAVSTNVRDDYDAPPSEFLEFPALSHFFHGNRELLFTIRWSLVDFRNWMLYLDALTNNLADGVEYFCHECLGSNFEGHLVARCYAGDGTELYSHSSIWHGALDGPPVVGDGVKTLHQEFLDAVVNHGFNSGFIESDGNGLMEFKGVDIVRENALAMYKVEIHIWSGVVMGAPPSVFSSSSSSFHVGTKNKVRFNLHILESKILDRFNKSFIDCGSGEDGHEDCALRCLAYVYIVHEKLRYSERGFVQSEEVKKAWKEYVDNKVKWKKYVHRYKHMRTGTSATTLLASDVRKMREKLNELTDNKYQDETQKIDICDLEVLCSRSGGFGFHTRIRLFEAREDGAEIVWMSKDRRKEMIEDREAGIEDMKDDDPCSHHNNSSDESSDTFATLEQHQIALPSLDSTGGMPPETLPTRWINLLTHQDHCYFVALPHKIQNCDKWCDTCNKGYFNDRAHKCADKCNRCMSKECDKEESKIIPCEQCNRRFKGQKCFDIHKEKNLRGGKHWISKSVCDNIWVCDNMHCGQTQFLAYHCDRSLHEHGKTRWCESCRHYVEPQNHDCVITGRAWQTPPKEQQLRYFDLETYLNHDGVHVCNYAYVESDESELGEHGKEFFNIEDFIDYVCKDVGRERAWKDEPDIRYIAHNGSRFDFQLVLKTLFIRPGAHLYDITRISKGNGIMMIKVTIKTPQTEEEKNQEKAAAAKPGAYIGALPNRELNDKKGGKKRKRHNRDEDNTRWDLVSVSFIDSCNFLKMPLRLFPATFGFEDLGGKGDFPHGFNTPENQEYEGLIPAFHYYYPDKLAKKEFTKLLSWWMTETMVHVKSGCEVPAEHEDVEHYICKELELYIERRIISYEELIKIMNTAREQELLVAKKWSFKVEMAKYCKNDVLVLKKGCQAFQDMCSKLYEPIAPRGGYVKGWGRVSKGEKLPPLNPWLHATAPGFGYDTFLRYFYDKGSWSYFNREMESWLRRAFSGGRTEAFGLYARVDEPEYQSIRKVDVCSEYPFINRWGLYTKGTPIEITSWQDWDTHPKIVKHNRDDEIMNLEDAVKYWFMDTDDNIRDKIGNPLFKNGLFIVELSYQAPANTHIPVLGSKDNASGKLMFDCRKHENQVVNCLELYEAIMAGYEIWNVKRILWWPKEQVVTGVFAEYINTFFGAKVEAGGYPRHIVTEEQKDEYIEELRAKNPGIKISKEKFAKNGKNVGAYHAAKLLNNSPWGKANQQHNKQQTVYFNPNEYEKCYAFMSDPTLTCKFNVLIPDKLAVIYYKQNKDNYDLTKDTCITVGIWTTGQGRLIVYRELRPLHKTQQLYTDTDSITYFHDKRDCHHRTIETDTDKLGAFTDEFAGLKHGEICMEYVAGGAKNYCMVIGDPTKPMNTYKMDIKIKGFNLFNAYADPESAQNQLKYSVVRRFILRHALQDWESNNDRYTFLSRVVPTADELDGKVDDYIEFHSEIKDDSKMEDEHEHMVEDKQADQDELDCIPVLTRQRFVLSSKLEIKHRDVIIRYGWTYDKRRVWAPVPGYEDNLILSLPHEEPEPPSV